MPSQFASSGAADFESGVLADVPWQRVLRGLCNSAINLIILSGVLAVIGVLMLAKDGVRDEATGMTQWRRILATESSSNRTNGTAANSTFPRTMLYGRDLYYVKVFKAGSKNITILDSISWVVVDPVTGASWNVTLPYFSSSIGIPSIRQAQFIGNQFIYGDNSTVGCVTVNTTSNSTSTSRGIFQFDDPTLGNLAYAKTQDLPFSFCAGTCSKTTPLAAGETYGFREFDVVSYNYTSNYTLFPPAHPVCLSALSNLPTADVASELLRNAPGATPTNGSALRLAESYFLFPGEIGVLLAFSNTTCLRLSIDPSRNASATFALYSEAAIGIASRRGVNVTEAGAGVATSAQCSVGPNRDANVAECDVGKATSLAVTSLDPTTRYFLMGQNQGPLAAPFTAVKTVYAADSCHLQGTAFKETPAPNAQGLITAAQQQSAAQAPVVIRELKYRIPDFIT